MNPHVLTIIAQAFAGVVLILMEEWLSTKERRGK